MKIFKNLSIALMASAFLLSACTDTKKQEKDALNEVIKVHDEAMAKSEQAIKNKMLLDSMGKANTPLQKTDINTIISNLTTTDKAMEDWMHQFNADYTGKTHEEVMQYLADQKKKVRQVNNQLAAAVNQSNQFIAIHQK
ncbi:hypothetical protein MUGA111182_07390 [Mucilaginibacter galii]|uniref:Viral A-type inclusion protein n=1 Tax=Mucilaginibacter galii TaxID=2005073 RepID=A0A917JB85_9SPHI|nr:hypothetical protein [Mucilaginibacter galii]GGI51392.1 hypothetical protein GCM10011425_26040 [Mucilaginibacter galii]